jgi:iron(III) transport system substrate-binding protein
VRKKFSGSILTLVISMVALLALVGCTKEVVKEVPTEVVVTKEVVKEVPVEVVVTQEVVREVPVEVVVEKEVIKEVIKTVEVPKEIVVTKEVVKEVPVTTTEVVVADLDPGELVIYSGRKESLVGAIIEEFENLTGVDVQVKYGKTFPVATMILEEGDNSPADIYYAQDPGGVGFLAAEGRLVTLPDDITGAVADWAKPADGSWIGISGRARVLVHTATLTDLPSSCEELTDAKWKGKLGWAPTNSSFQTMVTGMRTMWGEEKTKQWLSDMMANDVGVYPKNTPQVAAAAAEEISIGLVNHYYLHRFISESGDSFNARNLFLSDGGPCSLVMVSGAGIVDTGKNRANAEKFLRFMTSKVAQQYFTGQIYEYPVLAGDHGVKTHMLLPALEDLNKPDLSMEDLSDLTGTQVIFRDLGMLD